MLKPALIRYRWYRRTSTILQRPSSLPEQIRMQRRGTRRFIVSMTLVLHITNSYRTSRVQLLEQVSGRESETWFSNRYQKRDEGFLIDYSWGPFIARSVGGRISKCGLMRECKPTDFSDQANHKEDPGVAKLYEAHKADDIAAVGFLSLERFSQIDSSSIKPDGVAVSGGFTVQIQAVCYWETVHCGSSTHSVCNCHAHSHLTIKRSLTFSRLLRARNIASAIDGLCEVSVTPYVIMRAKGLLIPRK